MGTCIGSGMGNSSSAKFTLEKPIILVSGHNTIDLLSLTVGLKVWSIYAHISASFSNTFFKTTIDHLCCMPSSCWSIFHVLSVPLLSQYFYLFKLTSSNSIIEINTFMQIYAFFQNSQPFFDIYGAGITSVKLIGKSVALDLSSNQWTYQVIFIILCVTN